MMGRWRRQDRLADPFLIGTVMVILPIAGAGFFVLGAWYDGTSYDLHPARHLGAVLGIVFRSCLPRPWCRPDARILAEGRDRDESPVVYSGRSAGRY